MTEEVAVVSPSKILAKKIVAIKNMSEEEAYEALGVPGDPKKISKRKQKDYDRTWLEAETIKCIKKYKYRWQEKDVNGNLVAKESAEIGILAIVKNCSPGELLKYMASIARKSVDVGITGKHLHIHLDGSTKDI